MKKDFLDIVAIDQWLKTIDDAVPLARSSLLPKKIGSNKKESADYFGLQDRQTWGPKQLAYYTSDLFSNELVKTSHIVALNDIVKAEKRGYRGRYLRRQSTPSWIGELSHICCMKR